ncbi:aminotransferase class I/II-fold pyridoxal phosphate-dependent enzyme [Rhodococcus sp. F64268]|uniref:MalY/PatB family protein n=1 Tax=Rhodococcus sp. F64268 TaxID=2926402 RepID=UPI001FF2063D|nr:aminotransferase class I/II-fold pyridoxal phosphate-dependent enzyme [Rhodococcus sp. F64268]MCK0090471.1 aminotransferase class I/II-fold pyridoxal phosphate-dependent enzyme [Rhodococcus sp. F64268]
MAGVPGFDDLEIDVLSSRAGAKWAQATAEGLIPSWVADMDFPVAPEIRRALLERIESSDLGYPDWFRGTPLRAEFARRMTARYGWEPDPDAVREQTDLIQALQIILHLATTRGDAVAIQTPNYPPFLATIRRMGLQQIDFPFFDTGDGWELDFETFEQAVSRYRPRVLVLVNPHNPTGRVHTRDELERIADLAERFDILVVSDEIHAELIYEPHRHIPFASISSAAAARTVTITSASKAFNLAGLRCAVVHYGSAGLLSRRDGEPFDLYGAVSVPGVVATLAAWQDGDAWQSDLLRVLERNRRRVHDVLRTEVPAARHHVPEATYLSWIDAGPLGIDDPVDRIGKSGVLVDGGTRFGRESRNHVRINFATSDAIVGRILDGVVAGLSTGERRKAPPAN